MIEILNYKDKIYPNFYSGDEFQSSAFSYPSGAALFWLSYYQYYNRQPDFSRWDISVVDHDELSMWDSAYLECKANFGMH